MKTITYVGPFAEVEFEQGTIWRTARQGEPVEVPDDLADALLEQADNWSLPSKPKTSAAKKES